LAQGIGQGLQNFSNAYQTAQERQRALGLQQEKQNMEDAALYGQLQDKYKDVTPEMVSQLRKTGATGLAGLAAKPFVETIEGQKYQSQQTFEKEKEARQNTQRMKEISAQGEQNRQTKATEASGAQNKQIADLRKEVSGLQPIKTFQGVDAAYRGIQKALLKVSPQTDQALMYGYAKLLDPNSGVKEGEYSTIQQARGIPDTVKNLFDKINSGQALTTQQRQEIGRHTGELARGYYSAAQESLAPQREYATRLGLPHEQIFPQYQGYDQVNNQQPSGGSGRDQKLKALGF